MSSHHTLITSYLEEKEPTYSCGLIFQVKLLKEMGKDEEW